MPEEQVLVKQADLRSLQLSYQSSIDARKALEKTVEELRKEIEELKKNN